MLMLLFGTTSAAGDPKAAILSEWAAVYHPGTSGLTFVGNVVFT